VTAFRKVGEDVVYQGHFITVAVGEYEAPDGSRFRRDLVHHPGAVGAVPVDADGRAVLVRQYRAVVDDHVLEIPAGVRDIPGEDPLVCAQRELVEEIGMTAGSWEHLSFFHAAVGFSDESFELYLARDLTDVGLDRHGVEEQSMTIERVDLADVPALIAARELRDAKTIIGLLLAREHLS
jgi:ADP-ribose pyrophosphatase